MPRLCARAFIIWTQRSVEPQTASATATAASLAERISAAFINSPSGITSPARKPKREPRVKAALALIVAGELRFRRPALIWSTATISSIILAIEAGGHWVLAL